MKIIRIAGTAAILTFGGFLLYSASENTSEPEVKTEESVAHEPNTESNTKSENVGSNSVNIKEIGIKDYKVEHSEYTSLKSFVTDISGNWKDGSKYREVGETADDTLADATVVYVNYFEDEIKDIGLTEDFDELQLLAFDILQNKRQEGDYAGQLKRFGEKWEVITSKM